MRTREPNLDQVRVRNPFLDPLVTELIEDPDLYRRMFSGSILVGETLQVFQPVNAVVLGPQGSGKSMILNLIRYGVLSRWLSQKRVSLPPPLRLVHPFLGISINLTRARFHAFGRRSFAKALGRDDPEMILDLSSAADFLNQFLFREFLLALRLLSSDTGYRFARWLHLSPDHKHRETEIAREIASWDCWFGYYSGCNTIQDLLGACERRLSYWRRFLTAGVDSVPQDIWETKSEIGDPLHRIGNLLSSLSTDGRLPLYVVIDQYEVLPELNQTHGTTLQRVVNTLIKARDPVVFFKFGARNYDWGREVRIWGSESRIEVNRDYVIINLSDVLMRKEFKRGWLFPKFALDVAYKRIRAEGLYRLNRSNADKVFGPWNAEKESWEYFVEPGRRTEVLGSLPKTLKSHLAQVCGPDASPLDLRLAGAWALELLQREVSESDVVLRSESREWQKRWWKKERIGIALLQIASMANQRKLYYGWNTIQYLAGGNITAFLLICNEIWDVAARWGSHPLKDIPLRHDIQTEGVFAASEKWRTRDRNELIGGTKRYEVLGRLGPAIGQGLLADKALSNPGHSGFSLRESEIWAPEDVADPRAKVGEFLRNAVSWAILEERSHTSKNREPASRRKWYLHPLLSPIFNIPYVRVKEPIYTDVTTVYAWIFEDATPEFGLHKGVGRSKRPNSQLRLRLGDSK